MAVTIKIQATENNGTFTPKRAAFTTITDVSQNHHSAIREAFEKQYGAKATLGAYGILRDETGEAIVEPQKMLYGTVFVEGIGNQLAWIASVSPDVSDGFRGDTAEPTG